jgi:hypothetical protein
MEKEKKKIEWKDRIVILLSLAAFLALSGMIFYSGKMKKQTEAGLKEKSRQEIRTGSEEKEKAGMKLSLTGQQTLTVCLKGTQTESLEGFSLTVNGVTEKIPEQIRELVPGREQEIPLSRPVNRSSDAVISLVDSRGERRASLLLPSDEIQKKTKCIFSLPGGFYPSDIRVEIHAPDGWKIYYTTDGSRPTEKSDRYLGSVPVTNRTGEKMEYAWVSLERSFLPSNMVMGTDLRAIAVSPDGRQTAEMSQTYFIGCAGDSSVRNLPVISVSTDPDGLFDYEKGIFVRGRDYEDAVARRERTEGKGNYYKNEYRDAYFEFLENGKDKTWESRGKLSTLKSEFFGGQIGLVLDHLERKVPRGSSLFPFADADGIQLLVGGTDCMYKIREKLAGELAGGAGLGAADICLCTVFVDGEYWGVYVLKSAQDEAVVREKYGIGEKEPLEICGTGDGAFEQFREYVKNTDMSQEENYKEAAAQMDMENYINYVCLNMFLANANFGEEHARVWRMAEAAGTGPKDGRWRWITGSMQNTMSNGYQGNFSTPTIDTYLQPGVTGDAFLQSLLKNGSFRTSLEKTMKRICGEYTKEYVGRILEKYEGKYGKAIRKSYLRYSREAEEKFLQQETNQIYEFFSMREKYIMKYTREVIHEAEA